MKILIRQRGLTLVELMVSMVLMLVITLAAISLFSTFSASYKTADNSQGMQDDARFTLNIIGRALQNAGFQSRVGPVTATDLTDKVFVGLDPNADEWRVEGANASTLTTGSSLTPSTSGVVNASDVLTTRFFGANLANPTNPSVAQWNSGVPVADGSMVDCSGRAIPYPDGAGNLGVSAFFVKTVDGEPELQCASYNPSSAFFSVSQVARGVEAFQVAYGVDTDAVADGVPNQWLSADNSWSDKLHFPNWNRVVAVRVGLVMRGDVGSAQASVTTGLHPLGEGFSSEAAWTFTAPADGRIRKVFNATFLLRNPIE